MRCKHVEKLGEGWEALPAVVVSSLAQSKYISITPGEPDDIALGVEEEGFSVEDMGEREKDLDP